MMNYIQIYWSLLGFGKTKVTIDFTNFRIKPNLNIIAIYEKITINNIKFSVKRTLEEKNYKVANDPL